MQEFAQNRKKLIKLLAASSVAIIPAARHQLRNNDTEYPFRQNSNFYYLTGYHEADALCVLLREDEADDGQYILFNLAKDPALEVWTGPRVGQRDAVTSFGADIAYDISEADTIIPQLLKNKRNIYYHIGVDPSFDQQVIAWLQLLKTKIVRQALALGEQIICVPDALRDLAPLVSELRLFKSAAEIATIRQAAAISVAGHLQLLRACKPLLYEYQLEALFTQHCLQAGCRALAYQMIVASGNNACTLHYVDNTRQIQAGDLIVIDAGAEYHHYAADITRTLPASGQFTPAQRALYDVVLAAQLAGIDAIKPGNRFALVQEMVTKTLVHGLLQHGILHGDVATLVQNKAYKQFYMHGASHWLGLDVHDVGNYYKNGESRQFAPGMVLTIEPGLYIAANNSSVAPQWRGIGVRIEDMVLVTEHGCDVLTKDLPKAAADLEQIMAQA